ncbi:MAG: sigma factor-like helix-turn-helix DNA-binding protein [Candidatus Moraniibacteriota bacterium]
MKKCFYYNAQMYDLIVAQYGSVDAFCDLLGLQAGEVRQYINLTKSPVVKNGSRFRQICYRIADYLNISARELFPSELYQLDVAKLESEVSIERIPFDDGAMNLGLPDPCSELEISEQRECLEIVSEKLKPKEKAVIWMRFGLDDDGQALTFAEIASVLVLSRQRVNQLFNDGME